MEPHRLALPPGFRIENYEIQAVLGKGGFGITYVAYDWTLKRHMAIKELLPDTIATRIEGSTVVAMGPSHEEGWAWAKERFVEEAQILAGFHHPNIIAVHRLIEANGTVYLVMDHLEGESYEARMRRIGTEPDQSSLMAVIRPILDGLQEVHTKGLLHRDIKPENILFDGRGNPVLIDFGAARATVGATMTMTSIVTHGYSPAEQYQTKGKMGPWTDIYAMGSVMCRAITGEKPPVAADRLMDDDFVWLSNRGLDGFDEKFLAAVDWALRVRPEDRPQQIADWEYLFRSGDARGAAASISPITRLDEMIPSPTPTYTKKSPLAQPKTKSKSKRSVTWGVCGVVAVCGVGLIVAVSSPSAEKQYKQGMAYIEGNGVAKDDTRAFQMLLKSAKAGNANAQNQVGEMYARGQGVAYNDLEAVHWYRKAAEQGDAGGQRRLGFMYANGRGVAKDEVEAVKLYRKAAEQGDAGGQRKLGFMYEIGSGVAQNDGEAVKWYRQAANQGDTSAQSHLDRINKNGRGLRSLEDESSEDERVDVLLELYSP